MHSMAVGSMPVKADNVKMPFDETAELKFKIHIQGENIFLSRNKLIKLRLLQPIPDVDNLIEVIRSYNVIVAEDGTETTPAWSFSALRELVNSMSSEEKDQFFRKDGILQSIQHMAVQLVKILPQLKWLKSNCEDSLTLHQTQVASILACAFFCAFPKREKNEPSINFNTFHITSVGQTFQGIVSCQKGSLKMGITADFLALFEGGKRRGRTSTHVEKLKCIIHYFSRIREKQPTGFITFHRRCMPHDKYPRWENTDAKIQGFTVQSEGRIEDQPDCLQMDFANRVIGGGVLGWGCVQEEIRFAICPELIAARLFTEPLAENEAILIIGPERYCKYGGYADNFYFLGNYEDLTPFDEHQRRTTSVLAVDALKFNYPQDQYRRSQMLREIKKIYTGLVPIEGERLLPLATGNWGCGVYQGDPELKAVLQILAASQAGRDVVYFTFGDEELRERLDLMHTMMRDYTVGQNYTLLARYLRDRRSHFQTVSHFVLDYYFKIIFRGDTTAKVAQDAAAYAERHKGTQTTDTAKESPDKLTSVEEGAQKRSSTAATPPVESANKLPRRDPRVQWPRRWLDKFDGGPKKAEADLSRRFNSSLGNVIQTAESSRAPGTNSTSGRLSPSLFSDSEPTDEMQKRPSTPKQAENDSDDIVPCTPGQERGYDDVLKFYVVREKKSDNKVALPEEMCSSPGTTHTSQSEKQMVSDCILDSLNACASPSGRLMNTVYHSAPFPKKSVTAVEVVGPSGSREELRSTLEKHENCTPKSDSKDIENVRCDYDHSVDILDALERNEKPHLNPNELEEGDVLYEEMDLSPVCKVSTSSEEIPATPATTSVPPSGAAFSRSQESKPLHKKRFSQTTMDIFLKKS